MLQLFCLNFLLSVTLLSAATADVKQPSDVSQDVQQNMPQNMLNAINALNGISSMFEMNPFMPFMGPAPFFASAPFVLPIESGMKTTFDVASCRLTVDLSSVDAESDITVDLVGRSVRITASHVTSSRTGPSHSNLRRDFVYQSQTTARDFVYLVPPSCIADPKLTKAEIDGTSKILTVTFPTQLNLESNPGSNTESNTESNPESNPEFNNLSDHSNEADSVNRIVVTQL